MGFTELDSVEHYIIHQMSGVNLNDSQEQVSKLAKTSSQYSVQWQFQSPEQLSNVVLMRF